MPDQPASPARLATFLHPCCSARGPNQILGRVRLSKLFVGKNRQVKNFFIRCLPPLLVLGLEPVFLGICIRPAKPLHLTGSR